MTKPNIPKEIKIERGKDRYNLRVWSGSCEDAYKDFTDIAGSFQYLGTGVYMQRQIAIRDSDQERKKAVDVIGGMYCPIVLVRQNKHNQTVLEKIPFFEQRNLRDRQLVDYVLDSFAKREWKLVNE